MSYRGTTQLPAACFAWGHAQSRHMADGRLGVRGGGLPAEPSIQRAGGGLPICQRTSTGEPSGRLCPGLGYGTRSRTVSCVQGDGASQGPTRSANGPASPAVERDEARTETRQAGWATVSEMFANGKTKRTGGNRRGAPPLAARRGALAFQARHQGMPFRPSVVVGPLQPATHSTAA